MVPHSPRDLARGESTLVRSHLCTAWLLSTCPQSESLWSCPYEALTFAGDSSLRSCDVSFSALMGLQAFCSFDCAAMFCADRGSDSVLVYFLPAFFGVSESAPWASLLPGGIKGNHIQRQCCSILRRIETQARSVGYLYASFAAPKLLNHVNVVPLT
jgi:hypothetical protein